MTPAELQAILDGAINMVEADVPNPFAKMALEVVRNVIDHTQLVAYLLSLLVKSGHVKAL